MQPIGDPAQLEALVARATTLAAAWGGAAAGSTSVGQERAILRLFGVSGLDRAGHPLAAEVVDRYIGPDPTRLAGGIALPFAMAMAEYDLPPHELALEVAAGNVDLGLEAALLAEPDRRAVAVADATALARAALDRIDANRTARRELLAVLGDPARPWLGVALVAPAIVDALDEARAAIDAGAEVVRVDVPPSRELAERMARIGAPLKAWHAGASSRGGLDAFDPSGTPIPTGSQRALAVLRRFVDEAGARRRGYVRLATDAPALAAPDQAVVAAFERIDLVVADPMREIVSGRVDPDRAITDHVFAHRLLGRAGTNVLVPAGPLLVTPDLATGIPSDTATRAGRALALQLLAVELARRDGLAAAAVIVGAIPDWLVDEPDFPARAAAELALRRALLPGHAVAFIEPPLDDEGCARWQAVVSALLPDAGGAQAIVRRSHDSAPATRGMLQVAASLGASRVPPELTGVAAAHATGAV
ncbi:MAG TPA: lysine 5,6-aminomutase subunit alpha, partial [Candidatus Limnocylindrales bacterium]|nr:lysine 5,6-aminomutase subunit alpha [Candidatus Limnocylindrales bacterium]